MSVTAERLVGGMPFETEIRPPELDDAARSQLGSLAFLGEQGFVPLGAVKSPYEFQRQALQEKIIDQPAAIDAVIEALERAPVRLRNDPRPVATLAFLGPTGVGKSATAKETANMLPSVLGRSGRGNLIKIDCSDYRNGHEIAKLTGAPPSYVGREQPPLLAKNRVERPGTVVLFDEIEKGSPALYNLMLQIMGDGQLQPNNGNEVINFRNTVIILTSNLGSREMADSLSGRSCGFAQSKQETDKGRLEQVATQKFEENFAPEFINRIDKLVVFHPLSAKGIGKVLDMKLAEANAEYSSERFTYISLSDVTKKSLVDITMQKPHLGARPLIRAFEEHIQTPFGRYTGSGSIPPGTHIRVFHRDEAPVNYPVPEDALFILTSKTDEALLAQANRAIAEAKAKAAAEREAAKSKAVAVPDQPPSPEPEDYDV